VVWPDRCVNSFSVSGPQSSWKPVSWLRPGLESLCAKAVKAWLPEVIHRWAKAPSERDVQIGRPRLAGEFSAGYGPCKTAGFCCLACKCMDTARPQETWELGKAWLANEPEWQEREANASLALHRLVADNNAELIALTASGHEVPWLCVNSRSLPGQIYFLQEMDLMEDAQSQFEQPVPGLFVQPADWRGAKTRL